MHGPISRQIRRLLFCLVSVCIAGALPLRAAPALTLVTDIVYRADGQPAQGSVVISWPAFNTSTGDAVAAGTRTVTLGPGGVLQVSLAPNAGSVPAGTFYKVVMKLDSGLPSTEYWIVPQSTTATLAAIRTRLAPGNSVMRGATREWVDLNMVHRSGAETVSGVKTFTSPPLVPAPTTDSEAANKLYVDNRAAAGLGYTAENVANKNQPNGYAGLDAAGGVNAPIGGVTPRPGTFTMLGAGSLQIGGQTVIDGTRKVSAASLELNGSQVLTSIQGNGARLLAATGSFTPGNVLRVDANGNAQDSGIAAAILPTSASGNTTKYASVAPTFNNNQCVHTDSNGNLTTTGSDCGQGVGYSSYKTGASYWLSYLGDGSDGPYLCNSGTCSLYGERWYSSFSIAADATVVNNTAYNPLVIRVTGACNIAGTIAATANRAGGMGVLAAGSYGGTGGGGGGGTLAGAAGSTGGITGGGSAGSAGGGIGGNGNSINSLIFRTLLSNGMVYPVVPAGALVLYGGTAGGAGGSTGGAGGRGGGNVFLICGSISFTGTIDVSGQNGGNAPSNNTGAGGGGGGGVAILSATSYTAISGTVLTSGGAGGSCGALTGCGAGGSGANGNSVVMTIQ